MQNRQIKPLVNARLLIPKLYYFWFFAAVGAVLAFLPLHYRSIGLNETEIGLIGALPSLIVFVASPLWSALADARGWHRPMLLSGIFGWSGAFGLIALQAAFGPVMVVVCAQAVLSAPIAPLADSGVMKLLGERRNLYGQQRVWGSVGFALAAMLSGWLVNQGMPVAFFWVHIACGLILLAVCSRLPSGEQAGASVRAGAGALLRDWRWITLLVSLLLMYAGNSASVGFRSLFLRDIGIDTFAIGTIDAASAAIEIPFMLGSARLLRKFAPRKVMMLAAGIYVLVAALQWLSVDHGVVVIAQLLRGVAFALFWPSVVSEAQVMAPKGMTATAQSLVGTASFSLATVLANPASGWLYANMGYKTMFLAGLVCLVFALLGFAIGSRPRLQG